MELLETVLHSFVNLAMLLFEYIGVLVITFAGIQGFINYLRRKPETRLILAKGLAMGLEFKLGSEILRTVIVRNLGEIYIVAGIIALRAILTFLIHWEIKNEEGEGCRQKPSDETPDVSPVSAETSDEPETAAPAAEESASLTEMEAALDAAVKQHQ